ncbi:MAG TPA: tRNA 2-thiocytidine(32) synthetase TtcA [Kofleriaceae bacterium]|nr:tRNA 2-thiocytidine(32) synthetase TtcA [Kofleriaceae bacterium]
MADLIPASRLLARRPAVPSPVFARTPPLRAILKKVGRAIADHGLIADGDRIMTCVSGGKDSYTLLDVLLDLRRRSPVRFEVFAVNVDQGWPGYRTDLIAEHLGALGVEHHMIRDDFAGIVESKLSPGQTPCSLCSRFRRGVLYSLGHRLGATKIALGHHADDLIETLVLNMFYGGRLAAMPAYLRSDDGQSTVIRPLAYVSESAIVEYAAERRFPVVSCGCPSCGLPEQKRQQVKRLLAALEADSPGIKHNMLGAIQNVKPSHLLDRNLAPTHGEIASD